MLVAKPKATCANISKSSTTTEQNSSLNASDWNYLAEGGANVVFRYTATSINSSKWVGKVLRIAKKTTTINTTTFVMKNNAAKETITFVNENFLPILHDKAREGGWYAQMAEVVSVEKSFLVELNDKLRSDDSNILRPMLRHGNEINIDADHVLILPDVTYNIHSTVREQQATSSPDNNKLCVEIKPKCGFIVPSFRQVSNGMKDSCRYCMHQHLKYSQGKVNTISEYCPLDLYSQDCDRIVKALCSLCAHPQNNLRVFNSVDKEVFFSESQTEHLSIESKRQALCDIINRSSIFMKKEEHAEHSAIEVSIKKLEVNEAIKHFTKLLSLILQDNKVLDDLKQVQMLDMISIEGVWLLHQFAGFIEKKIPKSSGEAVHEGGHIIKYYNMFLSAFNLEAECEKVSYFLEQAVAVAEEFMHVNQKSWKDLSIQQFEEIHAYILDKFFVSTTAKDCSILISIINASDSNCFPAMFENKSPLVEYHHRIEYNRQTYYYVIAVVDLDKKPKSKLPKYYELDNRISLHFSSVNDSNYSACLKE